MHRKPVVLHGRTVVPGIVEGEALVSSATVSGWGGIDPARGVIIERRHPLYGQSFAGRILVFPGAKGSSGWSGFFHATRLAGTAPLGMIFVTVTSKAALGAVVTRVPTLTALDADPLTVIRTGDRVTLDADMGTVTIHPAPAPASALVSTSVHHPSTARSPR
ncbi:aconitase X swivel domain-containing protein [Streptomyces sp. NPDC048527]|uniref:aconitase X swivel domain-containing protein n=1 Tax=Streptomyces sp. NPDC048527 TaxID=3365568 RepID=UPI00371755B7